MDLGPLSQRGLMTVGVALILVTAGCFSGAPTSPTQPPSPKSTESQAASPGETDTPSDGGTRTTTATPTPTRTPEPTPTPTATATPFPNPWQSDTIRVALDTDDAVAPDRYPALLNQTFEYWNTHQEYRDYPGTFTYTPDRDRADIVVTVVEYLYCQGPDAVGCAAGVYTGSENLGPDPVWVKIEAGFNNDTALEILKHEFGHISGREHNETPMPLMEPASPVYLLPARDAVNRSWPWRNRTLSVYVANESLSIGGYPSRRYPEIKDGFRFYATDRDEGWANNVTFRFIDTREDADIVVNVSEDAGCDSSSCGSVWGTDSDGDGRLEWYSRAVITLDSSLNYGDWSWHVAWWLGYAFGADTTADMPDDLLNGDPSDSWWEED